MEYILQDIRIKHHFTLYDLIQLDTVLSSTVQYVVYSLTI